jgi:FKBP-type peptidyl-prolyl cis-trans isomerase
LIVAAIFGTAFVSCQGGSKSIKSSSTQDSIAYAIGVDVATNLRRMDSTFNAATIGSAIKDVFEGKGQMTQEEAYAFLNDWFQVRKPALDMAENAAWLEEVKAGNPNIQTTDSGLMYEIISEGDAAVKATNDADQVVANYRGTLKDGTEFDKNDSITFPLNGVIRGWTEGLKLVGKGGEINLWIPSDLGYGPQGSGPIPPSAALKFEVKLLDVIPAPVQE